MWKETDNKLVREFRFKDFQEAFTFMTRVAFISEKMGQTADWHWLLMRFCNKHDNRNHF